MRYLILLAALVAGPVMAQGSAVLTWNAPTACADNSALTNCVITGYKVEKQAGTAWNAVASIGNVLTYTDTGLALGSHTYRVKALSAAGESAPSNTATKIITVPGAPSGLQVVTTSTVAYKQRIGGTPDAPTLAYVPVGTIAARTVCLPGVNSNGYYAVPRSAVTPLSRFAVMPFIVWAECA